MLVSKIHLPRRTVLKALGATVGLPLLDAMIPAGTALGRTAAAPRPCASFIYFPHGAVMDQWTPRADEAGFQLPPILAPLAPFRRQLTIVSGLENRAAIVPPVHAITPATWLSCVTPRLSPEPQAAVTVDQVMSAKLGQDMPFDSIQVATEAAGGEGSSDRLYGSVYAKTISFRAPTTPLPMEHDPRKLFRRLFGQEGSASLEAGPLPGRSVLDLVRQDAADLSRKLGPRDRTLLADYLANVRSIEERVHAFVPAPAPEAKSQQGSRESSSATPTAFHEHMRLMFDLVALGYEAGLTRVSTLMMAAEVSNQRYDFIGVADSFHSLSHHGNSPVKLDRLAKVQAHNTTVFAEFVGKLARMPDGEGSMLDHSLIVYGSNMSNSNLHDHSGLPLALLGAACGQLAGDRHLRYPEHTPLANLHLALLNKVGIPTAAFGDSTTALAAV
jgi:Protein of unknown function (DUF1552)